MKNTIKLVLLASTFALTAPAMAADLGGMKDAPVYGGPTSWAGLYLGAHAGYGWGTYDGTRTAGHAAGVFQKSECKYQPTPPAALVDTWGLTSDACSAAAKAAAGSPTPTFTDRVDVPLGSEASSGSGKMDMNGAFGGIDLSYKFQTGHVIIEPFGDASFGGGSASTSFSRDITSYTDAGGSAHDITGVGLKEDGSLTVKKVWGGTLGAKIGVLVDSHDYVYALGGLAYGDFSVKGGSALSGGGLTPFGPAIKAFPVSSYDNSNSAWGYTLGAGWEHAVSERWHIGIEGRYTAFTDIGASFSKTVDYAPTAGVCGGNPHAGCTLSTSEKINGDYGEYSVLARISYKLN